MKRSPDYSVAPGGVQCPHCGPLHDRVCRHPDGSIDHTPWSRSERDQWREQARSADPSITFAPSSATLSDRFGARNREVRRG